jgi:hypothetical protein
MTARKLGVYMSPDLEALVKGRENHDSLSGRIGTVAERYREIMRRHKPDLTEAEWNACRDALNGVWLRDANSINLIWADIADTDRYDGLGSKWRIDGQALANRIRNMPYAQIVALVEDVETWWAEQANVVA